MQNLYKALTIPGDNRLAYANRGGERGSIEIDPYGDLTPAQRADVRGNNVGAGMDVGEAEKRIQREMPPPAKLSGIWKVSIVVGLAPGQGGIGGHAWIQFEKNGNTYYADFVNSWQWNKLNRENLKEISAKRSVLKANPIVPQTSIRLLQPKLPQNPSTMALLSGVLFVGMQQAFNYNCCDYALEAWTAITGDTLLVPSLTYFSKYGAWPTIVRTGWPTGLSDTIRYNNWRRPIPKDMQGW